MDEKAPIEAHLRAVELVTKISRSLIGIGEDKPDTLINQLEEIKQHKPRKEP